MIYAFAYAAREQPKIICFFVIELLVFFRGVRSERCELSSDEKNFSRFALWARELRPSVRY